MSSCSADLGAHHPWWPLLQAVFIVVRVLTTTSTTAVRIIAKGVFTVTSLMRTDQPVYHQLAGGSRSRSSWKADVRFGSKADIGARPINVWFTPKSGHLR
jgi:hypothetical protein